MTITLAEKLVIAIKRGKFDGDLEMLSAEITARRKRLMHSKQQQIGLGDVVVFNGKGTRYLKGVEAVVQKVPRGRRGKYFDLKIITEEADFRGSKYLKASAELFDKVEVTV